MQGWTGTGLVVTAAMALAVPAAAQKNYAPGITDTEIKIGQTSPIAAPLRPMAPSASRSRPISP